MKLAIPVKTNKKNPAVSPLFGKAKWFAIIKARKINIVPNNQSGGKDVIEWLYNIKIDAILIQEIGISPYEKAKELGLMLYHTGFKHILLSEVLEKFENNKLEILDDTNIDKIIKYHKKHHSSHRYRYHD